MAKKKSKAELKEERRRAIELKRRETGWEPPPEPDVEEQQRLADMAPLLDGAGEEVAAGEAAMMPFMELVLDSANLIEEPEFDGVYAHPLLCTQAFADAMEELGLEDVDPDNLPTAEQEESYAELMERTTMMVLTGDLQKTILEALGELRERAREEGDLDMMAHTAAVYAFLDGVPVDEVWPSVGVVQAVVHRSLSAGIEMYSIIRQEAERVAAGKRGLGLLRRILGATPEQAMEGVLNKYPGLSEFMAEQAEDDIEAGANALAAGKLDVGFFAEAEITAVFAKAHSLGIRLTEEGLLSPEAEPGKEATQSFFLWLNSYVSELSTSERLAQMQARLDEFAAQQTDPAWLAFLSVLGKELTETDDPERRHALLVRALVGEIQNAVREEREER